MAHPANHFFIILFATVIFKAYQKILIFVFQLHILIHGQGKLLHVQYLNN